MDFRYLLRKAAIAAVVTTLALALPSLDTLVAQDGTPTVAAVSVSGTSGETTVEINVSPALGNAVVSDFTMQSPDTVVVDMVGVSCGEVKQAAGAGLIAKVEVQQIDDASGRVCTVRLFLASPATHTVKSENGKVVVRLVSGASSDPLAAALSGGATDSAGQLTDQQNRGVAPGAVSGPSVVAGPALASLDFENLDNVSRVVIGTNGAIDYSSSQPEQGLIVVDLPGLQLPSSLTRVLDTSEFLSPVRMVRAYKTRDGVRVAISLRRNTEFTVRPGPNNLIYVDIAVPVDMQQDRALAKQGFSAVAPSEGGGTGEGLKSAYASEQLIGESGKTSDPQAAWGSGSGANDPSALLGASGFMFDSSSASSSAYGGRRINIDLVNADIHSVFRLISHVSRLNIVAGDDVKGTVTVRLEDVPWDQALAAILQAKGLGAQRFGNIVRIAPIETIKAEQQAAVEAKRAQDELTPLKVLVVPLNYAQVDEVEEQVRQLVSARGKVEVDERSNQLIIQDTEDRLAQIRELIRHIDRQTPQVQIETRIVEALSSFNQVLGIQWGGDLNASAATGYSTGLFFPNSIGISGGGRQVTTGGGQNVVFYEPGQDNLAVDLGAGGQTGSLAFSLGSIPGLINIDARLSALESDGYGEVVSTSRVLTLDNVSAQIRQGARIPYLSTSAAGTTVQFVLAALTLEVTPHITSDGKIFMALNVSNNRPDFGQQVQGQPAIQIKEAESQLLVDDGDTVVIGGVFTSQESVSRNRVPGFWKIPILGHLFRSRTVTEQKNEMLVFVTPKVVTATAPR